jgi:hypothetical protein
MNCGRHGARAVWRYPPFSRKSSSRFSTVNRSRLSLVIGNYPTQACLPLCSVQSVTQVTNRRVYRHLSLRRMVQREPSATGPPLESIATGLRPNAMRLFEHAVYLLCLKNSTWRNLFFAASRVSWAVARSARAATAVTVSSPRILNAIKSAPRE